MQLSREGSGCGGRRRHRHRHHLRRILPPTTPPTPPATASAEIATITINPAGVAITAVSTKSEYAEVLRRRGRAEALPEGAAAGAMGRPPNDYSRGSGSVTERAGRQRYRSERRQVSGTERRTTTPKRRRDRRNRPQA